MSDARRGWLIVAAMTVCQALVLFDIAAVGVALPAMRSTLSLSAAEAAWVVNIYLVFYASFVALGGRVADVWHRQRTFLLGVALFVAGSSGCGAVPAIDGAAAMAIAARAIQGLGGALMVPAALAIVIASVPKEARGRAVSIYIVGGQVFFVLAPVVAGALIEILSWRSIFLVSVPLGLVGAIALLSLSRAEVKVPSRGSLRFDGPSVLFLSVGIAATVLGLDALSGTRLALSTALIVSVALPLGIGMLIGLVRRESRVTHPLIPIILFRRSAFTFSVGHLFLLQIVNVAVLVLVPSVFQGAFDLSPSRTGLMMLAFIGGWVAIVPLAGWLYDHVGPWVPIRIGAILALIGMTGWTVCVALLPTSAQIVAMVLTGVGVGLSILPANTYAVTSGEADQRAATVGLVQTIRQIGSAVTIAAFHGLFFAAAGSTSIMQESAVFGFAALALCLVVNAVLAFWPRAELSEPTGRCGRVKRV